MTLWSDQVEIGHGTSILERFELIHVRNEVSDSASRIVSIVEREFLWEVNEQRHLDSHNFTRCCCYYNFVEFVHGESENWKGWWSIRWFDRLTKRSREVAFRKVNRWLGTPPDAAASWMDEGNKQVGSVLDSPASNLLPADRLYGRDDPIHRRTITANIRKHTVLHTRKSF